MATIDAPLGPRSPATLACRYRPEHLRVLTLGERRRFLRPFDDLLPRIDDDPAAWEVVADALAWELLYRIEPDLYARLVAGEHLHPAIVDWLPERVAHGVEVGPGLGRLTLPLAPRCSRLVAVEPAGPLRARLRRRLSALGFRHVTVVPGFFDALPVPDGWADATFACSVFTSDPAHGGPQGLEELVRVTADGGLIVIVWPPRDPTWLTARGFELVEFPGDLHVEFPSLDEALAVARVFYPHAVEAIAERRSRRVDYRLLGVNPPSTLAWRRVRR